MQVHRCRCGAATKIAHMEVDPGVDAFAVHCERFCGDDSHWQMSLTAAVNGWNAGRVRAARGGNGAASDDLQPARN